MKEPMLKASGELYELVRPLQGRPLVNGWAVKVWRGYSTYQIDLYRCRDHSQTLLGWVGVGWVATEGKISYSGSFFDYGGQLAQSAPNTIGLRADSVEELVTKFINCLAPIMQQT